MPVYCDIAVGDVGGAGWGAGPSTQVPIFGVRVAGRLYWKVCKKKFVCAAGFPVSGGDTNVTHTGNPRIVKNPIHRESENLVTGNLK